MSKTIDLLHKIDKQGSSNADRLEYLNKNFEDHKYGDVKWRESHVGWELRIEKAVQECPEAGHIKEQNGKISDMQTTLKAIKFLVKWILTIGTAAGIYFGIAQSMARGSDCSVQSQEERGGIDV
jgi:hypothetical protein